MVQTSKNWEHLSCDCWIFADMVPGLHTSSEGILWESPGAHRKIKVVCTEVIGRGMAEKWKSPYHHLSATYPGVLKGVYPPSECICIDLEPGVCGFWVKSCKL